MMLPEIALFSPLAGFLLASFLSGRVKDSVIQFITCGLMVVAAIASLLLLLDIGIPNKAKTIIFWQWLDVGNLKVSFGMMLDRTSLVMMTMVNSIACLIHIYSVGYMASDASIPRFMGYLSLFTFFMLALVSAPNLVQLFLGWEGVGLASYLLIGFWHHKPSANAASIKAFVMNRVGDAGLIMGLAGLFYLGSTLDISTLNHAAADLLYQEKTVTFFGSTFDILPFICVALFLGVMGKSAQLGLHTWLPDAMEGPTPVSALIHAATMVTAGVYLLIRLHPIFALSPGVQHFIAIMGASTCFFAATVALVQDDIKRIIAYSTCSQLGYMVMAAGMNAVDASFFHLVTHAFFKALLFLGAGSVIHALSDEQNIEKMGGLYRHIPFTYSMMWVGSLALAGIPFFSGFYSKDAILVATFAEGSDISLSLFGVGLFVAFMTALYS
ncbi:MAG: NADH-quinone oxidoreductase subunit L, partial [Alphaproteobacteria bacterium]|nr:NADH-quinone oxidoreductase subunit L [Alphaproteobacteria bacterium]